MCPMCQPFSGGGQALGSPVPVKGSCRRWGWGSLMPDSSRRLLGSVLSTPFSARSTGQVQRAQKCVECQLCTREMENALWSHKTRNMEFSFFFSPQTIFREAVNVPLVLSLAVHPHPQTLFIFLVEFYQVFSMGPSREQSPIPTCGCAHWVRTAFAFAECDMRAEMTNVILVVPETCCLSGLAPYPARCEPLTW